MDRFSFTLFMFSVIFNSHINTENKLLIGSCDYSNNLFDFTQTNTDTCHIPLKVQSNFNDWRLARNQLVQQSFPIDKETRNYVRKVSGCLFSVVKPVPLTSKVKLAAVSESVLTDILDLDVSVSSSPDFLSFVGGDLLLTTPLSHRYGGHQFGTWAGQLGDGRAVMLGEYINQKGDRFELQLKGSGKTPYSRQGDGRAVIRSSVREFLCSEALFHLG